MKPRQTVKNYHNSNVPQYQSQNLLAPPSSSSSLRDIDLAKLGINLDDMPNLQANSNLSNQEEIVKCLQAIYGKNSTEILQKWPALNDWPMQSVSPPDYSRTVGGGPSGSSNTGLGNIGNNIGPNFSNVINNTGNSSQPKQDLQFASNQHAHQTPAINQFRVSTSNIHSPQQQQLSQQKSVLSLHQQHQNDLSNRRLSHHHLSAANASIANLNTATNASNATSTSTPTPESNSVSTLGGNISKNSGPAVTSHVPNIMDALGTMDNVFYEGSMPISKDPSTNQQSLIRHQQLQKLLKATSSQPKSSSLSPATTTLSHRNDLQLQRNVTSNTMPPNQYPLSSQASMISPPQAAFSSVPKSLLNLAACSSSPNSASVSSLQSSTSKFSNMAGRLNLKSMRNASSQITLNNGNNASNNGKSLTRNTGGHSGTSSYRDDNYNQKGIYPIVNDQSTMLQHLTRSVTSATPANNNNSNTAPNLQRPGPKQFPLSLLSDDQTQSSRGSIKNACNVNPNPANLKTSSQVQKAAPAGSSSKDAYLASLQERAAKVGVSIGEINNRSVQPTNMPSAAINTTNNNIIANQCAQQAAVSVSPNQLNREEEINQVDRKEIESALSRVEARNDLSLLYPPMLLASNSQKQINALSAGLQGVEDSELFTKEVKRIVLEECNIIYECKECNNLFRSLANLVKHKRTYCLEHTSERTCVEMAKRPYVGATLSIDQPMTTTTSSGVAFVGEAHPDLDLEQVHGNTVNPDSRSNELGNSMSYNLRGSEGQRGHNMANDLRMLRIMRSQERKNIQDREVTRFKVQNSTSHPSTAQTSLSKLLQSQPKNRLPVSRDCTLITALKMTPNQSTELLTSDQLPALEGDKNFTCSPDNINCEQLVRNSSLAKTLLNEKARNTTPRQSLIELSKAESLQSKNTKRAAPKRKFLEDCIQKVKRDKLLTEEEEENEPQAHLSDSNPAIMKSLLHSDVGRIDAKQDIEAGSEVLELNSPGESENDSDMLMIDLDGPKRKTPLKKTKRRVSTAASSTASSTSSVKLNTSSALLKALTRPVDTKKSNATPLHREDRICLPPQETVQDTPKEQAQNAPSYMDCEPEVLSPLFDKYTCDICDTDYKDLESLVSHTVTKHAVEKMVYPCIFCSFSFITLENVCRHIIDIHKKPKAQVHRLKEVVRSRSFISTDFLACSDYSSLSVDNQERTVDQKTEKIADESTDLSQNSNSLCKFEGMRTRGKKRVDYNLMINNDISDAETYFRAGKSRSKSADHPAIAIDTAPEDNPVKAASVDLDLMDSDSDPGSVHVESDGDKCKANTPPAYHVSEHPRNGLVALEETNSLGKDDSQSQTGLSQTGKEGLGRLQSVMHNEEASIAEVEDSEDAKDIIIDDPPQLEVSQEATNETRESQKASIAHESDGEGEDLKEAASESDANAESDPEQSADESSSSSSSSAVSSSSTSSPSSSSSSSSSSSQKRSSSGSPTSPTSSSSSSSDISEDGLTLQQDLDGASSKSFKSESSKLRNTDKPAQHKFVDNLDSGAGKEACHSVDDTRLSNSNKHNNSTKDSKNQPSGADLSLPQLSNDSDSEIYPESDIDIDSTPSHGLSKERNSESPTKQTPHRSTSSNKSTSELTPSSSNAAGGGGIMKLKIQLKTRPDEKSKVYEIV